MLLTTSYKFSMGKKELKDDIVELLQQDCELQSIIREIVGYKGTEKDESSNLGTTQKDERGILDKSDTDYVAENKELRDTLAEKEKELRAQSGEIERINKEILNAKRLLSDVKREKENISKDLSAKEETCKNLRAKIRDHESTIKNFLKSEGALKNENMRLKGENENQAKDLSQRFAEGWELFCAYQKVSSQSKRLLSGVFVNPENFISFICGGAQDRSLEKIWDVIKGCLTQGNTKDTDILWDIFEYAVELVNSSKTERIYEIMDVKPGTPFDLDVHSLAPGSKAQGNIQEVYLLGYKNVYVGRIERKSIVSI